MSACREAIVKLRAAMCLPAGIEAMLDAALVAEQHQGEPVALPERMTREKALGLSDYPPEVCVYWFNACLDEIAKLGPLYTHADPGEVERLRETIRYFEIAHKDSQQHVAKIEAQLAERDALLRDVQRGMREYEQGCDQFPPFHHNQLMERIDIALSASAEPSAPKVKIRVPEGLVNCIEGNRVIRSDEKLVLFRPEEFGAVGDGVTDDTEAFRACVEAAAQFANPAELTDEQIIEVMHTHLNNADGGYVVDTAPGDVVKAGRALLACAGRSAQVEIDERAAFEQNRPDEILAQSSEQHQSEPVAWLTKCKQSGLVEQAEPNEKASNPEHWTDAFPVYDSPKSARSQFDYDRGFAAGTAECETLRAQLTERDALLEDLKGKTILSWADKHRIGAALERKP